MAKLRTRNHKVVLARSAGGDAGITVLLVILGVFMFLPMLYVIMQSLKPLDELWMYPPRFIVTSPTLKNFRDLFTLMNISWVPFSRCLLPVPSGTSCWRPWLPTRWQRSSSPARTECSSWFSCP